MEIALVIYCAGLVLVVAVFWRTQCPYMTPARDVAVSLIYGLIWPAILVGALAMLLIARIENGYFGGFFGDE